MSFDKITQPSRHDDDDEKKFDLIVNDDNNTDPRRFTKKELEIKSDQKVEEIVYFVYPNFRRELRNKNIPVMPDMLDNELTIFMTSVIPDTVEKKITAIVRSVETNRIEPNKGKRIEYMNWYETWTGTDKNGNTYYVHDLPCGRDKTSTFSRRVDNKGIEHWKQETENWIHTVNFSPQKLDEIVEKTNTDPEHIQFSCLKAGGSWGGFNYEEFKYLTLQELYERILNKKVGQPVPSSRKQEIDTLTNEEKTENTTKGKGKK